MCIVSQNLPTAVPASTTREITNKGGRKRGISAARLQRIKRIRAVLLAEPRLSMQGISEALRDSPTQPLKVSARQVAADLQVERGLATERLSDLLTSDELVRLFMDEADTLSRTQQHQIALHERLMKQDRDPDQKSPSPHAISRVAESIALLSNQKQMTWASDVMIARIMKYIQDNTLAGRD